VKKSFSRQQPKTELSDLLNMEANGTGVAIFIDLSVSLRVKMPI
jgi:hypothetical protein